MDQDEKIKIFGELLCSITARRIMKLLLTENLYIQEIVDKLHIKVSLVIYHINKMKQLNLIQISYKYRVKNVEIYFKGPKLYKHHTLKFNVINKVHKILE